MKTGFLCLFLLLLAMPSKNVLACGCPRYPFDIKTVKDYVEYNSKYADGIFLGKFTGYKTLESPNVTPSKYTAAIFDIEKSWKSSVDGEIFVLTGNPAMCGLPVVIGARVLIYANGSPSSKIWSTNGCRGGTGFNDEVEKILDNTTKSNNRAIQVTPPAPQFSDAERQTELKKRRQAVAAAMTKANPDSVMILFSAEPRLYTNDVDYVYRQENNFYYLTMLKKAGARLVLMPGNSATPEVLFLPKRDPARETWNGKMYSREEAQTVSGIKTVLDAEDFEPFVAALREGKPFEKLGKMSLRNVVAAQPAKLYLLQPIGGNSREWTQEIAFAETWKNQPTVKIENAQFIFWDLRLVKSPFEQALLQHAVDITTEAFGRSMAIAGRARMEYEVQAEVEYTFRRRNADFWGYPSIVGCGPNATTLHYEESQGAVKPNDLLLMDVGAEYDHYTADVTRTFPVSGKFSKEQAEIYQIVYDAQEAVARTVKPGANFSDVNNAAVEVLKDGLFKLGLITDKNSKQYRVWFMHGTSHWLGMNVHDVGASNNRFKPGNVFTNEPGIYIRADALDYLPQTPENAKFIASVRPAFEKYKNIGVRIEDDLLVTETGCEWLTKNLPRTINGIEEMITRARQELPGEANGFLSKPKTKNLFDESAVALNFTDRLNR